MKIPVYWKSVYGAARCYPADEKQKEALKLVTGHPTLTVDQIKGLTELGHQFESVPDPSLPMIPHREGSD